MDRNRLLRRVRIGLSGPLPQNHAASDIVKTFLKSPMLKKLEVLGPEDVSEEPIPKVESACHTHRFRHACVSVFSVSYLR